MASMSRGSAATLLALLFCATGAEADAANVAAGSANEVVTIQAALDPSASLGKSKAGALCLPFETFQRADIEKEFDAETYRAMLAEALAEADPPATSHRIAGLIDAASADICWPNVGFGNTDKIKGSVSMSVSWQVANPETGAMLASVATTGQHQQPKSGKGGLKGMLREAFAANIRELTSTQTFRLALASPGTGGQLIASGAARNTPAPRVVAPDAPVAAPDAQVAAPTVPPNGTALTGKKAAIANAVRLELGRKVTGKFDDTSYRSPVLRNRSAYYVLSAKKGQTVVMGLDCDFRVQYSCFYAGVMVAKSRFLELADAPSQKAFRVTLNEDNPLLEVWSAGDVDYALVVHADAAGDELWAKVKAERASYDRAVAQGKAERSAERGQLFGAVLQGLAQGTAEASYEQQQAQATQDQMLADVQRQAMQAQQAQEQARSPVDAVQQPVVGAREAQSGTSRSTGGSLTVESKTPDAAPAARDDAATNSGQEYMYCSLLKPGSFEGHNGARFFSAIAPVTIQYGRVQAASENFRADVQSAYGVNGSAGCSNNKDRAALERVLQEQLAVPSYRAHKTVMTGIQPRN